MRTPTTTKKPSRRPGAKKSGSSGGGDGVLPVRGLDRALLADANLMKGKKGARYREIPEATRLEKLRRSVGAAIDAHAQKRMEDALEAHQLEATPWMTTRAHRAAATEAERVRQALVHLARRRVLLKHITRALGAKARHLPEDERALFRAATLTTIRRLYGEIDSAVAASGSAATELDRRWRNGLAWGTAVLVAEAYAEKTAKSPIKANAPIEAIAASIGASSAELEIAMQKYEAKRLDKASKRGAAYHVVGEIMGIHPRTVERGAQGAGDVFEAWARMRVERFLTPALGDFAFLF